MLGDTYWKRRMDFARTSITAQLKSVGYPSVNFYKNIGFKYGLEIAHEPMDF